MRKEWVLTRQKLEISRQRQQQVQRSWGRRQYVESKDLKKGSWAGAQGGEKGRTEVREVGKAKPDRDFQAMFKILVFLLRAM